VPSPPTHIPESADVGDARVRLLCILLSSDAEAALRDAHRSGFIHKWLPEISDLDMGDDSSHLHKDILAHTFMVTGSTPPRLRLRFAALFHDVGKPVTRHVDDRTVTFRHHEVAGARLTRRCLERMEVDPTLTCEVAELVGLSGRFHGYRDGWTDAAVRRFARDAGPLLEDLLDLARYDCTTRHAFKRRQLNADVDELAARIRTLAREDTLRRERPAINGEQVMALLGIGSGPEVGQALALLSSQGPGFGFEECERLLRDWWDAKP